MVDTVKNPKKNKEPFDYSQCYFECRFQKKKSFINSTKHIYIMEN